MRSEQKIAVAKLDRQTWVVGIYRWVFGVAFLFAAFNQWPDLKWTIGLAYLALDAAIAAIIHGLNVSFIRNNFLDDAGERKTRHAILYAAELASRKELPFDYQPDFWRAVDDRIREEQEELDRYADEPVKWWIGVLLASGSLIWQLVASLFGIAIVVALTST
jgi:hypothetical protein